MNNEYYSKNIMIRDSLFMILVLFHYSRFKNFLANKLTKMLIGHFIRKKIASPPSLLLLHLRGVIVHLGGDPVARSL